MAGQSSSLTAHIETRPGQNVSLVPVAHQVVSGLLLGAVQVVHGDTQGAAAQHGIGAAG